MGMRGFVQLSKEQIHRYHDEGFLILESVLDSGEVEALRIAYRRDRDVPGEHRITEDDVEDVRAVYASHRRQAEFSSLVCSSRLLGPVRQLLSGSNVYVYQFKINAKPAFSGGGWSWHQDYTAWRIADNLPAPRLVNVGLFLDDVDEFNGPVVFVPGSHRLQSVTAGMNGTTARSAQHLDPDDIALTPGEVATMVNRSGMEGAKGRAGSVVFFSPEIVHGSGSNISPFERKLLIITYNDVQNPPRPLGEPRPEHLVSRDTTPLVMLNGPLVQSLNGVAV
jgi:ectoine hydroxylase